MKRICVVILLAITFSLSQLACSSGNQANANANANAPDNVFAQSSPSTSAPPNTANVPMPSGNANTNNDPFPELVMLYSQLFTARMKGDKAKADGILADEFKETTADGKVISKAQVLADISPDKKFDTYSLDDLKSNVNGDTGTVTGRVTLVREGHTETWQINETFSKKNGKWQAVSSKVMDYKKA